MIGMTNSINSVTTQQENNWAQKYYDLAVIIVKPKIKQYLNEIDKVSPKVLKQRTNELANYFIDLYEIQYEISKIDRKKELEYKKIGETNTKKYQVEAIDRQARNWLDRLSTALNILTIEVSKFDTKNSIIRDIIIFILSISIGAVVSLFFFNKGQSCPCQQNDSIQNTEIDSIQNSKNVVIEEINKPIEEKD